MLCTSSAIAILSSMYKSMRFDPARDLSPVALVAVRLWALAMTSAQRADFAPDLPAVSESGVPGFDGEVYDCAAADQDSNAQRTVGSVLRIHTPRPR